jgi:hypothetical protein
MIVSTNEQIRYYVIDLSELHIFIIGVIKWEQLRKRDGNEITGLFLMTLF